MRGIDELADAVATLESYAGDDEMLAILTGEATAVELADVCHRLYALLSSSYVEEWVMTLWPDLDSAKP